MNLFEPTPIEARLLPELQHYLEWRASDWSKENPNETAILEDNSNRLVILDEDRIVRTIFSISFQETLGPYRPDFILNIKSEDAIGRAVVECDGHEFHKTKHQRTHDTKRDRYFQSLGLPICRFTGHQICNIAHSLAQQAWEFCIINYDQNFRIPFLVEYPDKREWYQAFMDELHESTANHILNERSVIESPNAIQ